MRKTIRIAALAAAAMFLATACNVMRGDQEPGAYVDDAALTARVKAALLDDEQVAGSRFDVNVYQANVTLGGVTDDPAEARRAEEIARGVEGVKSVKSTIRVAQAGDAASNTATEDESTESSTTPPPQQ
jgi:hyperosmotically inducible periplasmic protein